MCPLFDVPSVSALGPSKPLHYFLYCVRTHLPSHWRRTASWYALHWLPEWQHGWFGDGLTGRVGCHRLLG